MNSGDILEAISRSGKPEAMDYGWVFNEYGDDEKTDWKLLGRLFSLHETFDDPREPLKPMSIVPGDFQTFNLEDLTEKQLMELEDTLSLIDDPEYSARINDVLWLINKDASAARRAVDAYISSALRLEDLEDWPSPADRYTRAFRLSRQIDPKGPLPNKIATILIERLRVHGGNDPKWLSYHLLSLLYEARKGDPAELAAVAQFAADRAARELHWERQRDYLGLAAKLHDRASKPDAAEDARTAAARSYFIEAHHAEQKGGGFAAHHHWEQALRAFSQRPLLKAEVPEIRTRFAEAGRHTLEMMQTYSHELDMTDMIREIRKHFTGHPLDEALFRFVSFDLMDSDKIREVAIQQQRNSISGLFSTTHLDYEGRVVGVASGSFHSGDEGYELKLTADIQRIASMQRNLNSYYIELSLQVLNTEHLYDEDTLRKLLGDTLFSTEEKFPILLRGLAAGFEGDFMLAVHLIIPQIEASLRYLFEQNGITARNLKSNGVEEAWGLDRLLSEEAAKKIIGNQLVFEFRSLLIDDFGPKLRHNIAHGLVPFFVFEGKDAIYAW